MKQEILCVTCGEASKQTFPTDTPYPGEHVKFVHGAAIKPMRCDYCGNELKTGDPVVAMSIWADYGGIPYYAWESNYIIQTVTP